MILDSLFCFWDESTGKKSAKNTGRRRRPVKSPKNLRPPAAAVKSPFEVFILGGIIFNKCTCIRSLPLNGHLDGHFPIRSLSTLDGHFPIQLLPLNGHFP